MSEQLKASIVRFQNAEGAIVGAGFLVSEKILLTCAHVVAQALRISEDVVRN